MTWIKFHEELTRGAKRGMPRALRFVFLELSLLARPLRGRIELPVGMSDRDAVVDLLGGNRREVVAALKAFTDGPDASILFETDGDRRYLTIPSWSRWNAGAVETPGASTDRSRRFRDAQRSATAVAPPMQRAATLPRVEESREDQIPPVRVDQGSDTTARPGAPPAQRAGRSSASPEIGDLPEMSNPETLLAALRAEAMLRPIATLRYAEHLAGQLIARGITLELARSTIADFALKQGPDAADMTPEAMARALGGFFANARRRAPSPPSTGGQPDTGASTALDAFDRAWSKAHSGETRGHDARDLEHAAKALDLAREAAGRSKGTAPEAILAHKIQGYLDDRDRLLAESGHPLRLFPGRFSSYGMPTNPKPRPPRGPREAEPPPVTGPAVHEIIASAKAAAPKPEPGQIVIPEWRRNQVSSIARVA